MEKRVEKIESLNDLKLCKEGYQLMDNNDIFLVDLMGLDNIIRFEEENHLFFIKQGDISIWEYFNERKFFFNDAICIIDYILHSYSNLSMPSPTSELPICTSMKVRGIIALMTWKCSTRMTTISPTLTLCSTLLSTHMLSPSTNVPTSEW